MEKTTRIAESSETYRKIAEIPLASADRAKALAALEVAERLISAMFWGTEKQVARGTLGQPKAA